jgi:hypothetical protein
MWSITSWCESYVRSEWPAVTPVTRSTRCGSVLKALPEREPGSAHLCVEGSKSEAGEENLVRKELWANETDCYFEQDTRNATAKLYKTEHISKREADCGGGGRVSAVAFTARPRGAHSIPGTMAEWENRGKSRTGCGTPNGKARRAARRAPIGGRGGSARWAAPCWPTWSWPRAPSACPRNVGLRLARPRGRHRGALASWVPSESKS